MGFKPHVKPKQFLKDVPFLQILYVFLPHLVLAEDVLIFHLIIEHKWLLESRDMDEEVSLRKSKVKTVYNFINTSLKMCSNTKYVFTLKE